MSNIVFLDTSVAVGIISSDHKKSAKWHHFIQEMISLLPGSRFLIPAPVWFEIAQWNKELHWQVREEVANRFSGRQNPLYRAAHYDISNDILFDAALYKSLTRKQNHSTDLTKIGKSEDAISLIDAIVSVYCLRYEHCLITLNQADFPEKYFGLIKIQLSPRSTSQQRDFACLLKPRCHVWKSDKTAK